MADIPTTIPFLEAAYSPRPQHPDTGGQSFMRAFERAQQLRLEAPERALKLKAAEQELQLNQIKLADAIRTRDDAIHAQGALTVFADRIRRAKMLGPSEPSAMQGVMDWVESNRGLLTLPAGRDLWKDYLQSIEEDRKNTADIAEIRARGENTLAGVQARVPASIQTVQHISDLRRQAEESRLNGDTASYQELTNQADMLQQSIAKSGTSISFDDSGRPIVQIGGGPATTGTQTTLQQKDVAYENALSGINDVLSKVRPTDVGLSGVVGEQVFDKWLSQLNPSLASGQRIQNRTALRTLRENLFAALSPERASGAGFSNKDAERIRELASGLEASTSYPDLQNRLNEIRSTIMDRVKVNAQALGHPVPDFAKTASEIRSEYEFFKAQLERDVKENRRTREQASSLLQKAYDRAVSALKQYHGVSE